MSERIIRTVCGDVSPEAFEFFHCHEHIWIDGSFLGESAPVRPIDDFARSLAELRRLGKGTALVDCQPLSAGGDADILEKLSRRSKVGIVAATGFHKLSFYRPDSYILSADADRLEERFRKEAERCGVIKTAVEKEGVTGRYEVLHTAAAKTAAATGLPVVVHIDPGADPVALSVYYRDRGVGGAVILCHLDRAEPDISLHLRAAERGAFLEYDTIARPKYHSDEREIRIIRQVCDAGFGDRILLGLDTTRERLKSYGCESAAGLDYLENTFIGSLRAGGLDEETVDLLIRRNPRHAISFITREGKKR